MKTAFAAMVLSAAFMGAACADPQVIGDQSESVQIKAPTSYRLATNEFVDYAYTYELDNGKGIQFTQRHTHYYAQLDGEHKVELHPQAPGVFTTASGARVVFRDDGASVAIRNYEKLAVSSNLPANTLVMAKR